MALTKLNNAAISSVTSAGLPTVNYDKMPAGTILQTVQYNTRNTSLAVSSSGGVHKLYEVTLVCKATNSHFLLEAEIVFGSANTNSNMDTHDHSFAFAYKGASDADSTYATVGGTTSYNRQGFTGTNIGAGGAWYQTDVPWTPNRSDTHSGGYDVFNQASSFLDTGKTQNAGVSLNWAVYGHFQSYAYINRARQGPANGGTSFFRVSEIKT